MGGVIEQKGKKTHGHGQQSGVCGAWSGAEGDYMVMEKIQLKIKKRILHSLSEG